MDNLTSLFVEAGTLMLAGMVFVFAFLGLLVIFINGVLKKLAVKYPDPIIQTKPVRSASANKPVDGISPNIVAAISSAVSKYRQQQTTNK